MYEETHRPYSRLRRAHNTISILARNQAGRHWVYSGHYPRIFVAPKNAPNAETKRWSGAVPIPLLALLALATSAHTSLGVLQELNPRPQLLKALVYHSATSAVWSESYGGGLERLTSRGSTREVREQPASAVLPNGMRMEEAGALSLVPAVSIQEEDEGSQDNVLRLTGLSQPSKCKDTPPISSNSPKCSAQITSKDGGGSNPDFSEEESHLLKLKQEHDLAKAVKYDNAEVPVHIWNDAICCGPPSEKERHAIKALQSFFLKIYRGGLVKDMVRFLQELYGQGWREQANKGF
jgi:hypothetical protein